MSFSIGSSRRATFKVWLLVAVAPLLGTALESGGGFPDRLAWGGEAPQAGQVREPRNRLVAKNVVVLYVADSPDSKAIAEYYAKARELESRQLIAMKVPARADLSRPDFDTLRRTLRQELADRGLDQTVRCLVTVYDMPLRVAGRVTQASDQARLEDNERRLREPLAEVVSLTGTLERLAGRQPGNRDVDLTKTEEILGRFNGALRAAAEAVNTQPNTPEKRAAVSQIEAAVFKFGGLNNQLQNLRNKSQSGAALTEQERLVVASLQGEMRGLEVALRELQTLPDSPTRQAAIERVVLRASGLGGLIRQLASQLQTLDTRESHAALDSELALLYWDGYPLARWVENPLHHRFDAARAAGTKLPRVLMTARLEGVNVAVTRRLIDDAAATEKTGLAGRFYVDARGLPAAPTGSGQYGDYDESLRQLAALARARGRLEVTLDNTEALFPPGSCPQAALYCGWYSVGQYVPAFTWLPGSVGYHIASFDAVDLRDPATNQWCKRMLETGVAVTVGAVAEPYLHSFPRPVEFFPLLMTGELTVAECYWRTLPVTSWMVILIGDPLYRPFAAKPALSEADVPPNLIPPGTWP